MKKRLFILDEDVRAAKQLQEQLQNSQRIEICGVAAHVEQAWQMLKSAAPDIVLLGEITAAERGVICQQFRLVFPNLTYIAACSQQDLVWEPFFRNLGIWVLVKPIVPEQMEALAMIPQVAATGLRQAWPGTPFSPETSFSLEQAGLSPTPGTGGNRSELSGNGVSEQVVPKRLITVYGPKGGVGKTFLSRELAIYFSQQKRGNTPVRVLAVDFNLDLGTFATALNLARTPNIFTWIREIDSQLHAYVQRLGKNPDSLTNEEWQEYASSYRLSADEVEKYVVPHAETGLHVLTSPRDIRQSFEIRNFHLYLILDALKRSNYDVILVDTAPDTTDATIQALFFAEQVVMVGNPVVDSIENIHRILKLLREAEYPEERILVCMNRLQRKEMFTLDEIRAYFQLHPGKKIFPIPDDAEVKKSINTGTPVMLTPGKSAAKEAIEALGKALLPDAEEKAPVAAGKGKVKERSSLFRWLWG